MTGDLVVLAAGRSTRFGGLKQLEPVGPRGETLLEYTVSDAVTCGCARVVFVIRRELEARFRAFLTATFADVAETVFVFQDTPATRAEAECWGTGSALLSARDAVRGPFVVCNADDFYGAGAVAAMYGHAATRDGDHAYALAGYRLDRTLGFGGGVSRAVCDRGVDGALQGLTEIKDLARAEDGTIRGRTPSGAWRRFAGDETVSMNLWAFSPDVFPLLAESLDRFRSRHPSAPGEEFLLSTALGAAAAEGTARVAVHPVRGDAFGVTHPADRDHVRRRLRALGDGGVYPVPLWPRRSVSPRSD